jgi:hypothetical protein
MPKQATRCPWMVPETVSLCNYSGSLETYYKEHKVHGENPENFVLFVPFVVSSSSIIL